MLPPSSTTPRCSRCSQARLASPRSWATIRNRSSGWWPICLPRGRGARGAGGRRSGASPRWRSARAACSSPSRPPPRGGCGAERRHAPSTSSGEALDERSAPRTARGLGSPRARGHLRRRPGPRRVRHSKLTISPAARVRRTPRRRPRSASSASSRAHPLGKVTGSVTGEHRGSMRDYSGSRGASFIPDRPFAQDERVKLVVRIRHRQARASHIHDRPPRPGPAGAQPQEEAARQAPALRLPARSPTPSHRHPQGRGRHPGSRVPDSPSLPRRPPGEHNTIRSSRSAPAGR